MLNEIFTAIDNAAVEVAKEFREASAGNSEPTSSDYFTFAAQQVLFVRLCGGDPTTLQGGNPEIGQRIVNNGQHIIDHYWRSDDVEILRNDGMLCDRGRGRSMKGHVSRGLAPKNQCFRLHRRCNHGHPCWPLPWLLRKRKYLLI